MIEKLFENKSCSGGRSKLESRGIDDVDDERCWVCTHNLAFFFGPGLPLTLGGASGPNATPELLLTPFFFTPSVGGGIDEGTGVPVPVGAGVFEFDSDGPSPLELVAATSNVVEVADDESFDGDSSLTLTGAGSNCCKALGDNFKAMIMLPFDDFRRAPEAAEGLVVEAIVRLLIKR